MTRPLAKSIINLLLKRVIVRTTTIKYYAQFDARLKFYVVVTVVCVCAYVRMRAIRLDGCGSQKRFSEKVEAISERRGDKKSDRLCQL